MRMKLIALALAAAGLALAQQPQTSTTPDCEFSPAFTGNGDSNASAAFSTPSGKPCVAWKITYQAPTTVTALSITFQGAPDAGNTPGSFVTFAGSVQEGSNPITTTPAGAIDVRPGASGVYYPWVRIHLSGYMGSGTVNVHVLGYRGTTPAPAASSTVTADQPGSNTAQADAQSNTQAIPDWLVSGMLVAGFNRTLPYSFNGSTWDRNFVCTQSAPITLSGSGNTQVIGLSGSTIVRICHVSLATGTPENIKITQGTGSNCGSSTADVTGFYQNVTSIALDFGGSVRNSAGFAICINQSAAQTTGGVISYAQY
jgi:hypothetical protein